MSTSTCVHGAPCRDEEGAGGPEARYTRAYEARVNPFTQFQAAEVETRVGGAESGCCLIRLAA